MLDRSEVGKRGYLDEDFRLFHLKDTRAQKLEYHYHEFDKLILLLRGRVTYMPEYFPVSAKNAAVRSVSSSTTSAFPKAITLR